MTQSQYTAVGVEAFVATEAEEDAAHPTSANQAQTLSIQRSMCLVLGLCILCGVAFVFGRWSGAGSSLHDDRGFSHVVGLSESEIEQDQCVPGSQLVDMGLTCDNQSGTPAIEPDDEGDDEDVVPRCHSCRKKVQKPFRLVNIKQIGKELPYLKGRRRIPQCMQGIIWMDQTCSTRHKLPFGPRYETCNQPPGLWQNEYVASMESWNPKTRCLKVRRSAWTYGSATKGKRICGAPSPRFCQTNADQYPDPCSPGAYFKGPFAKGLGDFDLERTSFGWFRVSYIPWLSFAKVNYAVLPVVDGMGKETEWFPYYLDEVSRKECKVTDGYFLGGKTLSCRLNEWATSGKMAVCRR